MINKYIKINNRFKAAISGFTLSEILIALVVIGIIAAVTVPVTLQNSKHKKIETKLRKFYSTMENAIRISAIEHGIPSEQWDLLDYKIDYESVYDWFDDFIMKYIKLSANCNQDSNGKCLQ